LPGKTEAETRLALYLLGDVSDSERQLLETEYFSDDEAFQKMLSAEDDLVDAYARGALSTEHRRLFEKRFLKSAGGRERLGFARTLAGAVAETPPVVASQPVVLTQPVLNANSQPGFWAMLWSRSPALSFAVVMLAILLLGGNTALLVERRNTRNQMEALRAERDKLTQQAAALQKTIESEQARGNESVAQIKSLQEQLAQANERRPERSQGSKFPDNKTNLSPEQNDPRFRDTIAQNRQNEFTVYPGSVRSSGGSTNRFTISKAQRSISLRLVIENPGAAESYRASIETTDGASVKSFDSLKPTSENIINLPRVPASELPSGVYVITLQGKQPDGTFRKIGDYTFNVVRK
jgi:hypothetical protein